MNEYDVYWIFNPVYHVIVKAKDVSEAIAKGYSMMNKVWKIGLMEVKATGVRNERDMD